MGHLDVWTILTGAASIISLFITLSDRFPAWQRHIKSTGLILGGFAIGRITAGSIPPTSESIQDPRLIGLVMILITIFAMLYLFVREMVKKNQDYLAYVMALMVLFIGVPQVMDKYSDAFPLILKEDYLLLAGAKEANRDYAGAIRWLERYKATLRNHESRAQIEGKISKLRKAKLGSTGDN